MSVYFFVSKNQSNACNFCVQKATQQVPAGEMTKTGEQQTGGLQQAPHENEASTSSDELTDDEEEACDTCLQEQLDSIENRQVLECVIYLCY